MQDPKRTIPDQIICNPEFTPTNCGIYRKQVTGVGKKNHQGNIVMVGT